MSQVRVRCFVGFIPLIILESLPSHTEGDDENQREDCAERRERGDEGDGLHDRASQKIKIGVSPKLED